MDRNMLVVFAALCVVSYILYMLILVVPVLVVEAWGFLIEKIRKFRKHFQRWNEWRTYNSNSKFHKILVLFGLVKSPTFELFFTNDEAKEIFNNYKEEIGDDIR
jgi:hypothetical protein